MRLIRNPLAIVLTRIGLFMPLACGGRTTGDPGGPTLCVPGRTTACACVDGSDGVQVCADDGRSLLACSCAGLGAAEPNAGSVASGGAGAMADQAAAGRATTGGSGVAGASSLASAEVTALPFTIVDAEYSTALDSVVALATSPDELHVLDASGTDVVVALPLPGAAVSVAPDGQTAVVGHDGWVTEVDLTSGAILQTVGVSAPTLDIVLAANHYAYVFPTGNQQTDIRSVNLTTGKEEPPRADMQIQAGTVAKLEPGALAIYGVQNGLSVPDIERYDISKGVERYSRAWPDQDYHPACGDLWFSEDGKRIFTRCNNVFNASSDAADDMTYAGALEDDSPGTFVSFLVHSAAAQKVIALRGPINYVNGQSVRGANAIFVFDDKFLRQEREIDVGSIQGIKGYCSYVFAHSSGKYALTLCTGQDAPWWLVKFAL
jgi:hypothetical protein